MKYFIAALVAGFVLALGFLILLADSADSVLSWIELILI
jgi:hypothetical protein